MKLSNTKKAIFALIIANVLWGMGPPIFKWAFADIHIGTLAFLRFAIPAIILGIFFNKQITLQKKDIGLIVLMGLCDVTLNIAFYFIGIFYTASINAAIMVAASPVFLILGSMIILREIPTKKVLLGNLIGLAGIVLIIVQPLFQKTVHASIFGNILLLFSVIAAVIGTILAKKVVKRYSIVTISFWAFAIGGISFFPFFARDTLTYGFLPNLGYQGVIGILFGIFGTSLTAYFLAYWSLKYFFVSQTGVFSYLDPIASMLIAAPLLGEHPTLIFLLGSGIVFVGIYVAEKRINYHPFHLLLNTD